MCPPEDKVDSPKEDIEEAPKNEPKYITQEDLDKANKSLLDEIVKRLNLNNQKEPEAPKEEAPKEKIEENYDF